VKIKKRAGPQGLVGALSQPATSHLQPEAPPKAPQHPRQNHEFAKTLTIKLKIIQERYENIYGITIQNRPKSF
jgi:hypothetical protein